MTPRRRLALATIAVSGATLIASGVAGALHVPSGANIAAMIIITLSILVEAPIVAMAVTKRPSK